MIVTHLDLEALRLVLLMARGQKTRATMGEEQAAVRRVEGLAEQVEQQLNDEAAKRQKHHLLAPSTEAKP